MDPKIRSIIVLAPMTFVCFLFAVGSTFFFSAALDVYTRAGDEATTTMLLMLGGIAMLPTLAVTAVGTGWRMMASERYGLATGLGFLPLVAIGLDVLVMQVGGFW